MTPSTHAYDPTRRVINVADARLNRILLREPTRCASVDEYAEAAGMTVEKVLDLLSPYINDGTLAYEYEGDTMFVHTASRGRPTPEWTADVAPNLWELLRSAAGPEDAYHLWHLHRRLEWAGWAVEAQPSRITFAMSKLMNHPPHLAVVANGHIVPVIAFPAAYDLAAPTGLLGEYERAGALCVAVVCEQGSLEDMVTASRRWILERSVSTQMSVMVLEGPRYNPTFLSAEEGSVVALDAARAAFNPHHWENPDARR